MPDCVGAGLTETRRSVGTTDGAGQGNQAEGGTLAGGNGDSEGGGRRRKWAWRAGSAGGARRRVVVSYVRAAAAAGHGDGRDFRQAGWHPNHDAQASLSRTARPVCRAGGPGFKAKNGVLALEPVPGVVAAAAVGTLGERACRPA